MINQVLGQSAMNFIRISLKYYNPISIIVPVFENQSKVQDNPGNNNNTTIKRKFSMNYNKTKLVF